MYTISSWTNSYQMSQVHSWRYVETLVIKSYIFPERKKQPPKEYPSNDLKLICERIFLYFPYLKETECALEFHNKHAPKFYEFSHLHWYYVSIISFLCPENKTLKNKGKYTYQYQIHLFDPADHLWQTSLHQRSIMVIQKWHHKKFSLNINSTLTWKKINKE